MDRVRILGEALRPHPSFWTRADPDSWKNKEEKFLSKTFQIRFTDRIIFHLKKTRKSRFDSASFFWPPCSGWRRRAPLHGPVSSPPHRGISICSLLAEDPKKGRVGTYRSQGPQGPQGQTFDFGEWEPLIWKVVPAQQNFLHHLKETANTFAFFLGKIEKGIPGQKKFWVNSLILQLKINRNFFAQSNRDFKPQSKSLGRKKILAQVCSSCWWETLDFFSLVFVCLPTVIDTSCLFCGLWICHKSWTSSPLSKRNNSLLSLWPLFLWSQFWSLENISDAQALSQNLTSYFWKRVRFLRRIDA